jgi:hypothetical protein
MKNQLGIALILSQRVSPVELRKAVEQTVAQDKRTGNQGASK